MHATEVIVNVFAGAGYAASNPAVGSGDFKYGIRIISANATGNVLISNFIGTDSTGTIALSNLDGGVDIEGGATNDTIGSTSAAFRNIISGNGVNGVEIYIGSSGNLVEGCYVGTGVMGVSQIVAARGDCDAHEAERLRVQAALAGESKKR